jgi:hypothetical protein
VSVPVLHDEYLVDTGFAVRRHVMDRGPGGYRYGMEIHTNHRHFEPPVTVRKTVRLIYHCMRSRRGAVFLNFQGPGISGEYDAVPVYEAVMYGWLALRFPRPSMFEREHGNHNRPG